MSGIFQKIEKKFLRLRLQPIRVFVIHTVTPRYSPEAGFPDDWMSLDDFAHNLKELKKEYTFISPEEACRHLKKDVVRVKKYAVLTSDDGYRSLLDVVAITDREKVPLTLFLNAKYADGVSYSPHLWQYIQQNTNLTEEEFVKARYLTAEDIRTIAASQYVILASHGYEHTDYSQMNEAQVKRDLQMNREAISTWGAFHPFHAYAWGLCSRVTDKVLENMGVIPCRADGQKNYNDATQLHREYFPKHRL